MRASGRRAPRAASAPSGPVAGAHGEALPAQRAHERLAAPRRPRRRRGRVGSGRSRARPRDGRRRLRLRGGDLPPRGRSRPRASSPGRRPRPAGADGGAAAAPPRGPAPTPRASRRSRRSPRSRGSRAAGPAGPRVGAVARRAGRARDRARRAGRAPRAGRPRAAPQLVVPGRASRDAEHAPAARARSVMGSNGLVSTPRAPSDLRRSTSDAMAFAVRNTTGMPAVAGSSRSPASVEGPSRPGIITSSRTASGCSSFGPASASAPFAGLDHLHPAHPGQAQLRDAADVRLVVDDEDLHGCASRASAPSISETTVRTSTSVARDLVRNRVGPRASRRWRRSSTSCAL